MIVKSLMLVFIVMQDNIFGSIYYREFIENKLSKTYRFNQKSRLIDLHISTIINKIKKVIQIQFEKRNYDQKISYS